MYLGPGNLTSLEFSPTGVTIFLFLLAQEAPASFRGIVVHLTSHPDGLVSEAVSRE